MIRKLIPIHDIVIPQTIITETAKSELSFISESLLNKSELFFVTVTQDKKYKKYTLVDRYDVYLAAVTSKLKEISAVIVVPESDCTETHFQITMKSVMNPVKIINSIRPYVEKYGLDDTVQKLHLHSDFAQMYRLDLGQDILDQLDGMITNLNDTGVRTSVPLTLFIFVSKVEPERQSDFIKSLYGIVNKPDRHFRWPHNTFLRRLESGSDDNDILKKIPEKKLRTPDIDFCCEKCDTEYVVSDGAVKKKDESDGMMIYHTNDSAIPRILIPVELVEHLGVTLKKPPKIISSANLDASKIIAHLKGKKFIIILGEKQG